MSNSSRALPIGVVLPTRNCAGLLVDHLEAMRPWLDRVQEVVVVDSDSKDGTRELLVKSLHHPRLQILQHPPGLYQSWNFAVSRVETPYCYISTVGESIEAAGLEHLTEVMTGLRCDVAISKPRFVDVTGRPMDEPEWPIDDIVATLSIREPAVIFGAALFVLTLVHYRNAVLGSSASNLYRTQFLQTHPFATDYGTVGDGAWGLQYWPEARVGITARRFSTFREHPKSYSQSEYAVDSLGRKLLGLVKATYLEQRALNPEFAQVAAAIDAERAFELLRYHLEAHEALEACRRSPWPWSLNLSAWRERARRASLERELEDWKKTALVQTWNRNNSTSPSFTT